MDIKQAEKLLKRAIDTSEVLALAQSNLAETNATIIDVLVQALAAHAVRADSDETPPTMQ